MPKPRRYTDKEMMGIGLTYFKYYKWEKYNLATNIDRFKSQFGVIPETANAIWNALIDTDNVEAKLLRGPESKPKYLLMTLRWLFTYETERQLGPHFDIHSTNTTGRYLKVWARKIQMLLFPLVRFSDRDPTENFISLQLTLIVVCVASDWQHLGS
jgi:hypothetical protein